MHVVQVETEKCENLYNSLPTYIMSIKIPEFHFVDPLLLLHYISAAYHVLLFTSFTHSYRAFVLLFTDPFVWELGIEQHFIYGYYDLIF